jgi:antitoxin ParD1/3/4/toxin ParE1/3/4
VAEIRGPAKDKGVSHVLSVGANSDSNAIWDYIARDNIDAADSWIAKLFDTFEALGRSPGIGHTRKDLTPLPVLFWPVGAYLVTYRAGGHSVAHVLTRAA